MLLAFVTCHHYPKMKKIWNASRICVSSLRRGHANLLCIVPILVYVPPKRVHIPIVKVSFCSFQTPGISAQTLYLKIWHIWIFWESCNGIMWWICGKLTSFITDINFFICCKLASSLSIESTLICHRRQALQALQLRSVFNVAINRFYRVAHVGLINVYCSCQLQVIKAI